MTLSSSGGLASSNYPRLFNTSSVGIDPDLGSPNEYCTQSGPGKGLEGGPAGAGPNGDPLGNVLIIQNRDKSITIPDDSVDGGSILFDFSLFLRLDCLISTMRQRLMYFYYGRMILM
jgi:hypothetical protein